MNKGIIVGIVAVIVIIAVALIGYHFISPLLATSVEGEWQQSIILTYADGTTETIDNTKQMATIVKDGNELTGIKIQLEVYPENIDYDFDTISTTFLDPATNPDAFSSNYIVKSTSGTEYISNSHIDIMHSGVKLSASSPLLFNVDSGLQEVGRTIIDIDELNTLLPESESFELSLWYDGTATYTTGIAGAFNGVINAPDGTLTLLFETTDSGSSGCTNSFDVDNDGEIDSQDVAHVYTSLTAGEQNLRYDVNCDGVVNNADIQLIQANYDGPTLQLVSFSWDLGDWIYSIVNM